VTNLYSAATTMGAVWVMLRLQVVTLAKGLPDE
jgi:hypothetical protein